MSPQWDEMITHAVREADRLGIELCIHNCAGWSSSGGPWNTPEHAMQFVTSSERQVKGPLHFSETLPQPPTKLGYYSDIAVLAFRTPANPARIPALDLADKALIPNWNRRKKEPGTLQQIAPGQPVAQNEIIDLTAKMQDGGKLTWDVPEGEWTILRLGHTPTGKDNHPAPAEGTGPECDKLSKEALDAHWAGMMKRVLDDIGPLAGKSLNNALIDSYEVGNQNWTPKMREEFQRRRGYDMFPFLPVFAGRVVGNAEQTERFLWDLRRTVSDLFAENYYGHFMELCHQAGLKSSIEPYTGPYDSLQNGAPADIPMGEFWSMSAVNTSVKLAASVGHIYGRPVIGAESFTATPDAGKWQNDPASFKALGDLVWCTGVNRYIFHRYAMQPWLDKFPGMTMGQWGFHFERTNTWWNQGAAWLKYVARGQFMLQQGRFAADALYFMGEDSPKGPVGRGQLKPALPAGFDFDMCGANTIMDDMTVENGLIKLKSGMTYRVLVLPEKQEMTPRVLWRIARLVNAGATVVGPRPLKSPSLQDYPKCDADLKAIADKLWGDCDGKEVKEYAFGKGKVFWGQPLEEVFASLKLAPDFESVNATKKGKTVYIHRIAGDSDIYFVSNQKNAADEVNCIFRVNGKVPEMWDAESGKIEKAPVYEARDGRVTVALRLEPAGSVFVVFRKEGADAGHVVNVAHEPVKNAAQDEQPKLLVTKALYEALDGAGSVDVTARLNKLIKDGALSVVADNSMAGDPANLHVKRLRVEYTFGGKPFTRTVQENDTLELPEGVTRAGFPQYELKADGENLELRAWEGGKYSFQTTAGKRLEADVASVPQPLTIEGAWALSFPPNWGAPPNVQFDKLISWSERPESGVKYFSGTATYRKAIEIPGELIGKDKALYLDLGRVRNIAEVSLNGKPLGILWKPPFRVEVTGAAQAGKNELEVKVTNMWCNRLIGDEQLPDDCEWNGKQLKAWPEWLLKGEKRPSCGRFTFTTWHHFTKDSPLYESGLIGPVVLRSVQKVAVALPQ